MVRNTAREIAVHLSYELGFTDKTVEELLEQRLTAEAFASLAEEDELYQEAPNAKQADYIRRLVRGVKEHGAELTATLKSTPRAGGSPASPWWPPPLCGWRCTR